MESTVFVSGLLAAGRTSSQAAFGTQANTSIEQARRLVLDHGEEAVARDLQQEIEKASPVTCKAVQAVLLAVRTSALSASVAPLDAAACSSLRSSLFGRLPSWVHSLAAEDHQFALDLVTAFMSEVEQLSATDLTSLISAVLSGMEQKQPHCCILLELLPPCLTALQAVPDTDAAAAAAGADAAEEEAEGLDPAAAVAGNAAKHRDAAIHRLLHCQWQPEHVCQVLTVLKGLPMTPEQLKSLLAKAIRACRNAGLQQLPPILYQVLLVSGSMPGTRCYALRLIISLFDILENQQGHNSNGNSAAAAAAAADSSDGQQAQQQQQQPVLPSSMLMQVQATLLMHVSTLLKYDAALGTEWLKWLLKEAGSPCTNYLLLQVLLTMSRQPKLEQQVLQLLKRRINEACEADVSTNSSGACFSRWMSGLQPVNKIPTLKELEDGLLKAIRCSAYASELVAPGLLQLAASLISTSCSSPLHVVLAIKQGGTSCLPSQAPAAARAVVLGLQLLQELFEVHAEARSEVLKVVQAQLSCSSLDAALPIVLLLGRISQHQPALLSSYIPQLKECLSSFAGLSSDTAMALLMAIWPLCRVRADLQDFTIMLLRKMMYRQDVTGRLIAIRGFMRLICQHLEDSPTPAPLLDPSAASCSQASLSQMSSLSGSRGVNLLQELTGVLRRALSQQAPVRQALYAGVLQVLTADPAAVEVLAELLLPHLQSLMVEDRQGLPPLLLHKCAELSQGGDAALVEPLPSLLNCVNRLTAVHQQQSAAAGAGVHGSLEGSENWPGDIADEEQTSTAALKACFASIRSRLGQCQLDHFDFGPAAELSPLQPDGLLGQLHASNLMGSLQVVIGDAVDDALQLSQEQQDAEQRDGDQVNKLGEELLQLFELHNQLFQLALEGGKAGSKRGRKAKDPQVTATDAEPTATAAGGQKRSKPADGFTPIHKQRPHFSAACLSQLCMAIVDDGLLQLPSNYAVTSPNYQVQLARDAGFRGCVLRNCANLLEHARSAAAASALLKGSAVAGSEEAALAAPEVLELGPALFSVSKLVMQTASAGGRPSSNSSNSGNESKRSGAAAAAAAGDGCETLECLSATALLQLLKLADATQQLAALFRKLPLEDGSFPPEPQQGNAADGAGSNTDQMDVDAAPGQQGADAAAASGRAAAGSNDPEAVAAAVMPRMPQLLACTARLLQQGCFKEAQVMMECLALLGKCLRAPDPSSTAAAVGQAQQQQQEPAYAALSRWAHEALQQEDPEVKSVPLVKALLELYIRFDGVDFIIPLKTTMQAINEVVGDTEGQTQATQDHGTILPMLIAGKTAQPAAVTPLNMLEEGLSQLEKLATTNLKGGVFQDGDSAATAKTRRRLAAAMCKRLQELLLCLRVLVGTIIAMPAVIDHQTRVATHAYKLLGVLAKAYQLPKKTAGQSAAEAAAAASRALSPEFEALVAFVHKELTPSLNHALKDLGMDESMPTLSRVKKDAKLMPALVYNMEAWEKQLVATGKSAHKNLLRDAKRTFCRDFKVKPPPEAVAPAAARQQQPSQRPPAGAAVGRGSQGRSHTAVAAGGRGGGAAAAGAARDRATQSSSGRGSGGRRSRSNSNSKEASESAEASGGGGYPAEAEEEEGEGQEEEDVVVEEDEELEAQGGEEEEAEGYDAEEDENCQHEQGLQQQQHGPRPGGQKGLELPRPPGSRRPPLSRTQG